MKHIKLFEDFNNINESKSILALTKKYALVEYKKSTLEYYNPSIIIESDDIDELENLDTVDESPTHGYTIVEKTENGLIDYYTKEPFVMNSY